MGFKEETLTERNEKAAKAKQAMLEKFRAKVGDEATRKKLAAERTKVAAARGEREKKRAAEKQAAAERAVKDRAAAEMARLEAEKQAFIAAEKAAVETAARKAKAHADQKAARDERYARRKKAKRK